MLKENREYFRPMNYPWAWEYAKQHEQMHWLPTEVELSEDVYDWVHKLTSKERNLITQVLRFFTNQDINVLAGYSKFMRYFGGQPEVGALLGSIAAREFVHQWAYSFLIDQLGLPETEFRMFLEYKEMEEKNKFLDNYDCTDSYNAALSLCNYAAFAEGLQLFSSFAILMNFPRYNKLKGVGKIVEWSCQDEMVHVEAMSYVFKQFMKEEGLENNITLKNEIRMNCLKMVEMEDQFIQRAFEQGEVEGLEVDDMTKFIRYMADYRMEQFGLGRIYNSPNPIPWFDRLLMAPDMSNFFETKVTDYAKGATQNTQDIDW